MNRPVTKLLLKILLEFRIMEPILNKKKKKKTTMCDGILRRAEFLGAIEGMLQKRDKNTLEHRLRGKKERKEQCMEMHEHVTCKKKSIIGKNQIQTTTLTINNQSHNPKMHEHMKKC